MEVQFHQLREEIEMIKDKINKKREDISSEKELSM